MCAAYAGFRGFSVSEKRLSNQSKLKLVDNSFFRIFDFSFRRKSKQSFAPAGRGVVISEDVAKAMFGADWKNSKELLGHPVLYNNRLPLTLSGVVKNPPANSHIQFDVLLSMSMEESERYYHWDNHNYHTYVLLNNDVNTVDLDNKLDPYYENNSAIHFIIAFHCSRSMTSTCIRILLTSLTGGRPETLFISGYFLPWASWSCSSPFSTLSTFPQHGLPKGQRRLVFAK